MSETDKPTHNSGEDDGQTRREERVDGTSGMERLATLTRRILRVAKGDIEQGAPLTQHRTDGHGEP